MLQCASCPLRSLPLFEPMTNSEVDFMERFRRGELIAAPGTELLAQGSTAPQLFTVVSGLGLRARMLADGRRQVLGFVLPGDFLGLQASVMDSMSHSVEAVTKMRLCVFNRSDLWSLFKARPDRGYDIAHLAAAEETLLGEAITAIGQMEAAERIAWALARFHARLTALGMADAKGRVPLPYRQVDLADALGLSLVHTNKTLGRLRRDGLADWSRGVLTVLDVQALYELGHVEDPLPRTRPLI